jgi:hypothetical protein
MQYLKKKKKKKNNKMFVKINKPWEKKIWKLIIGSMYVLTLMVFYNRQSVSITIWIIIPYQ